MYFWKKVALLSWTLLPLTGLFHTHSSVVSLGRPFGSVVRPLLLQRTTVSRQEHSAGHLRTGEQLFSSLPDRYMEETCTCRESSIENTIIKIIFYVQYASVNYNLLHLTIFACKVLDSNILDGNLLEEIRALAARVSSDDAFPS